MGTREKLVSTAANLFQRQGVGATGLAEILKVSGTPKGSLYYYFPQGKDQLTEAAIAYSGEIIIDRVKHALEKSEKANEAVKILCQEMADNLSTSGHIDNLSISLIALETVDNPVLQRACSQVFNDLEQVYAQKLRDSGLQKASAKSMGGLLQATIEGTLTIAATKRQPGLLLSTADYLSSLISMKMAE